MTALTYGVTWDEATVGVVAVIGLLFLALRVYQVGPDLGAWLFRKLDQILGDPVHTPAQEPDVEDEFVLQVDEAIERERHLARHHRDARVVSLDQVRERAAVVQLSDWRRGEIKAAPIDPPVDVDPDWRPAA